jgi:hypothetical protein
MPRFTLLNSTVSQGFEVYVISIKSQAIDRCGRFDVSLARKPQWRLCRSAMDPRRWR